MNSNANPRRSNPSSQAESLSFANYQFDFGFSSNHPSSSSSSAPSLKDYKTSSSSSSSSSASSSSRPPNKPSWTHQPSPTPTSMAGDIFGNTWASNAPSTSEAKNRPVLFGDLVGAALGQGKNSSSSIGRSNVPLKNMAAAPQRNLYSMGNLADSLPKTVDSTTTKSNWESSEGFSTGNGSRSSYVTKVGLPVNSKSDPFESLVDFGVKQTAPIGNSSKSDPFDSLVDFGVKQTPPIGNSSSSKHGGSSDNSFTEFRNAPTSSASVFGSKLEDFGALAEDFATQMPPTPLPPTKSGGVDPLDLLFSSSSSTAASASASASGGLEGKLFSDVEDWGLGSEFGGDGSDGGVTIDLEGLPPPPAGVTATIAKGKGLDHHKQGQYADAIKWLSWAVALLEKAGYGDDDALEILSCRAECYKEVGQYKKAVADCSKILEQDSTNVSVLLQRALLYESSEKYKLGAEDLRAVLKIDPGNRLAKSTIHRLARLADL